MTHARASWLRLTCAIAATSLLAATSVARAQAATLSSDSTAWQHVLEFVVSFLNGEIVRAAADSSGQPWEIQLPADEPQRALLERQLRTILRARAPGSQDSIVYALELGPLRILRDTARVQMRTNATRRCPGTAQTTGWGNSAEILVPRGWLGWGAARIASVLHGDRVGCRRPPR